MATTPDTSPETSFDVRVTDFLDDRLQSALDLDNLDDLLESIETQRTQLQSQLDNAVKELEKARRKAAGGQEDLNSRIEEFKQLQDSIDTRVQIAAASDAPSQAIARLQAPMKKVDAVEQARKYLILLRDVDKLRLETKERFAEDPKGALEPYSALKKLSSDLRSMEAGEGLHLVDHVESVTQSLWNEMKDSLSADLEGILNKHKWPKVDPSTEMDDEWVAAIEKLVVLQVPEIMFAPKLVSLLPFDIMAQIFATEFRFHFMSDKRTSDPQVIGSHCFPWFIALIEKWEDFFRDNLSHLLAAEFYDTPAATNAAYVDPVCAFITAMLPVMREKVFSVVSKAVRSPSFLSSLISQLITFDETLRTKFGYDGGDAEHGWPGLATEVLDEHFDAWFEAEKNFAAERFRTIMNAQDAHNIDYDYTTDGRMKPTFAAVRVTDLLRSLTNQYNRVRKFKHKIRFLIGIQLDILDEYHDRLRGSLEAYQAATSTLGRTLHGVSKEQIATLEGTGGLESLCKVLGSSDHIVHTLQDWGNEDFFVALWDELQTRAARRASGGNFSGNMSYDDVKGRTSSSVGVEEDGGLFDETIAAYTMRRTGAQDLIIRALDAAQSKALRNYVNRVQWTTIGDSALLDDPSQLAISPELDQPLLVIRRNLEFLIKAVSTACYRRIWREALSKIQDQLWHDVLVRQTFSTFGAAQFARDVGALFTLVDRFIPHGSAALDSLAEGLRLLNLPAEAPEGEGEGGEEARMTLKEASDRVFMDNDEARAVLEELQLRGLTPANARLILQKRVENSENVGW